MKKRILTLLLVLTMACTSLVGCGDSGASNNDTSNNYNDDDYIPTPDDVQDAFDQVQEQENKDKYSDSEYTKVTIYPYKPKRENEIDHLEQDLDGNSINWVYCWEDITVDFYIPNELFGDVTYYLDNTEAHVTINKKDDNNNIIPMKLRLSVGREGYSQGGSNRNCSIENYEKYYNDYYLDVTGRYEVLTTLESSGARGTLKFVYALYDKYDEDECVGIKLYNLSSKCTGKMELKVEENWESEDVNVQYAFSKVQRHPEVMYEVLDVIEIELNDETEK